MEHRHLGNGVHTSRLACTRQYIHTAAELSSITSAAAVLVLL